MQLNYKDYIISNPAVMLGKPVIKGTRITVELIMEKIANDIPMEEILESHPHITRKQVLACVQYALETIKNEVVYTLQEESDNYQENNFKWDSFLEEISENRKENNLAMASKLDKLFAE
ncbi:MAG: DUF433 domain-containing protein [Thermoflexibacter sp.]|jgi:uncharacterized protein (DUF433 family)|nr:DUF433 domain-containing protein [Thermoflexibacter sp.]